mgnify:CR=1 FL=1
MCTTYKLLHTIKTITVAAEGSADFSGLAALHYASSGLKALTTELTAEGIEVCRRSCGGHGYSKASGLPTTLTDYLPSVTYEGKRIRLLFLSLARLVSLFTEFPQLPSFLPSFLHFTVGENSVMFLQTARFLLKSAAAARRGEITQLPSAVAHFAALAPGATATPNALPVFKAAVTAGIILFISLDRMAEYFTILYSNN